MRLSDLPLHRQPREKLRQQGADHLSEAELLAVLLRTGYQGKNALEVARRLLKWQTLSQLLAQPPAELAKLKGIGPVTAATLTTVWAIVQLTQTQAVTPVITKPEDVLTLTHHLTTKKQEYLMVILLNARNQLLSVETITIGTLNSSLIHAREVFAVAISQRAAALILVHNHPSGNLEPSDEDIITTDKLVEAGKLLDIPIFDHVIVSSQGWYSFKHHQLL